MKNNSSKMAPPVQKNARKIKPGHGSGHGRGAGVVLVSALLLALGTSVQAAPEAVAPVAGLQPFARPAGAPVIQQFSADAAWQKKALTGIDAPHTGLGFLKDQGAWFTPFMHPGLKGGYDIRGLHAAREQARPGSAKGN